MEERTVHWKIDVRERDNGRDDRDQTRRNERRCNVSGSLIFGNLRGGDKGACGF